MSCLPVAVLLLAGLATPRARAQTPPEPRDPEARTLLQLEDSWAVALVRRDGATFRRLLADGFVYTENDRTSTRDEVLHEVEAGPDKVEAAHNEDMRVYRFGPTAAVTGWLVVRGRGADGPFDRRYRFTDTWVRRGGRWQIVAAHDYLAPAARR
jgi:ketosteroid isomerase-like protein